MKKFLLLICVAPCLLSAQNATVKNVLKDRTSVQQVLRNLSAEKRSQVRTRSGSANSLPAEKYSPVQFRSGSANLPDSVYRFSDKDKTDLIGKTHIKYDTDGRKTEEILVDCWDGNEQVFRKIEYTYTLKDGKVTAEEILYWNNGGAWYAYEKEVYVLNESDLINPVEIYSYDFLDNQWVLYSKFIAVKFDAGNRPTVYDGEGLSGSEDGTDEWITASLVNTYNPQGLRSSRSIFIFDGILITKEEFFYNDAKQLIKHVGYDYEFDGSLYMTGTEEYKYDEKGNVDYMYNVWSYEDGDSDSYEEYYTNFYPTGNANEVISSIQSAVYPTPASEVLYVTIEGAGETLVSLVNLSGSAVFRQTTNQPVLAIPLQSFAKGTYILTIQAGAAAKSHKVIIR